MKYTFFAARYLQCSSPSFLRKELDMNLQRLLWVALGLATLVTAYGCEVHEHHDHWGPHHDQSNGDGTDGYGADGGLL